MERKVDIHKAAGVLLRDRKFLVARSRGKNIFVAPGGKLEQGESLIEALQRELREELGIEVRSSDLREMGTFYAAAAGQESAYLQMDVFFVDVWKGEITPSAEVEELLWINSAPPAGIEIGSVFLHDVLPRLKTLDLID